MSAEPVPRRCRAPDHHPRHLRHPFPGGASPTPGAHPVPLPPPAATGVRPGLRAEPTVWWSGASVWFDQKVALTDVSCSFGPGVTGLLGPNGAGKTTLRAMTGLLALNEGRVEVMGRDPRRDRESSGSSPSSPRTRPCRWP